MKSKTKKLTIPEEETMKIIWNQGSGTIKHFWEQLPPPRIPYTTFASTIKNLESKGYITGKRIGNTYLYEPLVKMEEYKKRFLSEFVSDYFTNSYKELVSFFIAEKKLDAKELKEIIKMIEKGK